MILLAGPENKLPCSEAVKPSHQPRSNPGCHKLTPCPSSWATSAMPTIGKWENFIPGNSVLTIKACSLVSRLPGVNTLASDRDLRKKNIYDQTPFPKTCFWTSLEMYKATRGQPKGFVVWYPTSNGKFHTASFGKDFLRTHQNKYCVINILKKKWNRFQNKNETNTILVLLTQFV